MNDDYVEKTTKFLGRKYLVFRLNDNQYALPLSDVKEVIGLPSTVPIPESPPYLLGLINLRGRVISAIDLKMKLGMQKGADIKRPVVVLVKSASSVVGCVVDGVAEVLTIKDDEIERSAKELPEISMACILGVARFPNRPMILLLDAIKATQMEAKTAKAA